MMFRYELSKDNSYIALGQLIKVYRTRIGYSLRDLGEITNVSHTLIANIEQGKVKGNTQTIKDLLSKLDIQYYNFEELYDDFKTSFEKVFNHLFKYEYTWAIEEMEKMIEKEDKYFYSILITDYVMLKFLYLALLGKEAKDRFVDLPIIRRTITNLSPKQKQIYLLVEGINSYNEKDYKESVIYLRQALEVGQSNLDYLVKVFLVKNYVKTYNFMGVVKTGNEIIAFFENKVIYLRAMEVRLSIAYALLLNRQYYDAGVLIDSVYDFAYNFKAIYLIAENNVLKAAMNLSLGNIETARSIINELPMDRHIHYNLKMRLAAIDNDDDKIKEVYQQFHNSDMIKTKKDEYIIDVTASEYGVSGLTEKEYEVIMKKLINLAIITQDGEVATSTYNFLERYYRGKRMYKKALEASSGAKGILQNGF